MFFRARGGGGAVGLEAVLEVYSEEGGRLYHPSMMLKVSLYGYALGMTSSRRLEQRIRIMEGRCVRGRKKQARRGRKPNVSPVRQGSVSGGTLGMTSSRRLEQRIQIKEGRCVWGRKKQARRRRKPNVSPVRQGWVSGGTPTSRSARGAALDSHVSRGFRAG